MYQNNFSARKPSVEGCRLKNVFTLRSIDDANNISKSLNSDRNVVIVGGSFIGEFNFVCK